MYALVACFLLSGVTFSRYIASTGTSDSARVAYIGNVQISESGDFYEDGKLMLIPGVDLTKDVRLDYSHTEIASYVFITVDAQNWNKSAEDNYSYSVLDGKVAWSIDKSWTYLTTQDTGERVYYITVPAANEISDKPVIADSGKITVSQEITKTQLNTLQNLTVSFQGIAVQLDGFDDYTDQAQHALAAWNSVNAK